MAVNSTNAASLPRPGWGPGRWLRLGALGFLGLLVLGNLVWRLTNGREATRLLNAARARGEAVTLAEVAATYPPVADAENGYRVLETLWSEANPEFWNAFREGLRPLPQKAERKRAPAGLPIFQRSAVVSLTNELDADTRALVNDELREQAARLKQLHEALRRPSFHAPVALTHGFDALLPHLAELREEGKWLQLETLEAVEAGAVDRALDRLADEARLGTWLDREPTLISQLVRLAIHGMTLQGAEWLVNRCSLTAAQWERLEGLVVSLDAHDALKRALITERAIGLDVFDRPTAAALSGAEGATASGARVMFGMWQFLGMAAAERRLMAETYEELFTCIARPDYAAEDQLARIFGTVQKKARRFPPKILTGMLLPALEKAGERFARFEALRRCALITVALERERLAAPHRSAAPPSEIPSSVPEALARDPFGRGPLQIRPLATGYVVYSVGPDHRDDGGLVEGRPGAKGGDAAPADVGFRCLRPARP